MRHRLLLFLVIGAARWLGLSAGWTGLAVLVFFTGVVLRWW